MSRLAFAVLCFLAGAGLTSGEISGSTSDDSACDFAFPLVSIPHDSVGRFRFTITEASIVVAEFPPDFFVVRCYWDPWPCCGGCSWGWYGGSLASGCSVAWPPPFPPPPPQLTGPFFDMRLQSETDTAQTDCLLPGTYYFESGVDSWSRETCCAGRSVSNVDTGFQFYAVPCGIRLEIIPNKIHPYIRGVIPVAILGGEDFSIVEIDVTTIRFGPGGATCRHDLTDEWTCSEHIEDVNLDGFMDLMTHYRVEDTGINCGDTSATLTGSRLDGTPFVGIDYFETVGCNSNRPHPGMTSRDFERMN